MSRTAAPPSLVRSWQQDRFQPCAVRSWSWVLMPLLLRFLRSMPTVVVGQHGGSGLVGVRASQRWVDLRDEEPLAGAND